MRPEKEYLVEEVETYLDKGDYLFLAGFDRLTVEETATLRSQLAERDAEFHVIKNSILNVATKRRELPDLNDLLTGQTAIVVGGNDAPGVAKVLIEFHKKREKVPFKGGLIGASRVESQQLEDISRMPSIEEIRAKFLGLLQQPAQKLVILFNVVPTRMVTVLAAVPRSFLGVLNAKKAKDEAAA